MSKVSIVGSGNVGATAALYIAQGEYAEVTLVDIVEGMPQGKALDLLQTTPTAGWRARTTWPRSRDPTSWS